ncbi:hypothetical protein [Williamsia sp. CHRR-6]|uniref:hypothetical protein n=1 Tax=Williamsia sp. CHRR-6 TaxID=2835871 RepID=UPI001BD91F02|nr:hypothetical protein [Williamsia sp. CHRR-6]MBT0568590.1 hypothetical protein [Williamsia sp. CHRR-6]
MAVFRGINPIAAGALVWDQIAGPGDMAFDDLTVEDRAELVGLALDDTAICEAATTEITV